MKKTLNTSEAADLLVADKNAGWSYAGARALVEHIEQIEEDTGDETEFDAVALRCEFTEYASALDAAADYGFESDAESANEDALDWLRTRTAVIEFGGGIIVQAF